MVLASAIALGTTPARSAPDASTVGTAATPDPWFNYVGVNTSVTDWTSFTRNFAEYGLGMQLRSLGKGYNSVEHLGMLNIAASACQSRHDIMLDINSTYGGTDMNQSRAYFALLMQDRGSTWKSLVADQAERLLAQTPTTCKIYWEIGNEINSPYYSQNVVAAANGTAPVSNAGLNEPAVIPVYAEKVFAPAVEALQRVISAHARQARRAYIVLGTLANAANPASRDWYKQLLDYRIRGDFAPSLTGKRVSDLIDVAAMHYFLSRDTNWRADLDQTVSSWLPRNGFKALWHTEEIGLQYNTGGQGGGIALRSLGRYFSWIIPRKLASADSHLIFWTNWADTAHRDVDAVMRIMTKFMNRNAHLKEIPIVSSSAGEAYAFADADTNNSAFAILSGPSSGKAFNRVDFKAPLGMRAAACYRAENGAVVQISCQADSKGVTFDAQPLAAESSLVALLTRN